MLMLLPAKGPDVAALHTSTAQPICLLFDSAEGLGFTSWERVGKLRSLRSSSRRLHVKAMCHDPKP